MASYEQYNDAASSQHHAPDSKCCVRPRNDRACSTISLVLAIFIAACCIVGFAAPIYYIKIDASVVTSPTNTVSFWFEEDFYAHKIGFDGSQILMSQLANAPKPNYDDADFKDFKPTFNATGGLAIASFVFVVPIICIFIYGLLKPRFAESSYKINITLTLILAILLAASWLTTFGVEKAWRNELKTLSPSGNATLLNICPSIAQASPCNDFSGKESYLFTVTATSSPAVFQISWGPHASWACLLFASLLSLVLLFTTTASLKRLRKYLVAKLARNNNPLLQHANV